MKRFLSAMFAAALAAVAVGADQNDLRYTFWSKGPDTYKDGAEALDGEFYALVWVKAGDAFGGFNADGTLANAANKMVVEGPYAQGGRCKPMLHLVSAAESSQYAGGSFQLHLLDTRKADGTLAGYDLVDGAFVPRMVNGYESVCEVSSTAASLAVALGVKSPIAITKVSGIPDGTPKPQIVDVQVRDGANGPELVIRAKGTAAYLNYIAAEVSLSGEAAEGKATSSFTGSSDPDAVVEIVVPATGNRGLYKLMRK